jgi:hypothetical protein
MEAYCGGEYTVDESDMDPMPDGADDDEESKYDNENGANRRRATGTKSMGCWKMGCSCCWGAAVVANSVKSVVAAVAAVAANSVGPMDELVDTTNITDVYSIRLVANIIKRLQREEELI